MLVGDVIDQGAGRDLLRLVLFAMALLGCTVSVNAAESSSSIRTKTESAFLAAVAVGEADAPCSETIGKDAALALVRYCRWVSSATHPPCNTGNQCALIVRHIRGMCSAWEAKTLGQTCERFGPSDWKAIGRFPAR